MASTCTNKRHATCNGDDGVRPTKQMKPSSLAPRTFYYVRAVQDGDEGYRQVWSSKPYLASTQQEAAHLFLKRLVTHTNALETCVGLHIRVFKWDPEEEDEPELLFASDRIHEVEDDDDDTESLSFVGTTFDLPTTILTVNAEGVVTKDEPKSPDDIVCDLCNQPKHLHGAEVDCEGACDGPAGEGCECSHHNR